MWRNNPKANQLQKRIVVRNEITLRDQMAIAVMTGTQSNWGTTKWAENKFVEYAYNVADLMLKQRKITKR
jgi:hypothetical protein